MALQGLLGLIVAAIAAISGYGFVHGNRAVGILPLVLACALGLGFLALTRFSGFVLLLIAVRPSLDLIKLSGSGAGTSVNNTATARGIDPSSIVGVLFLLAALVWLAGRTRSGHLVKWSRLGVAVVAFLLASLVSVIASLHVQASALEFLRIGSVVTMFIVLEQLITSRAQMIRVITACYVALLFPLLYTLVGILLRHPASELKGSFTRLTGPFGQSNIFARYLSFVIIFGVAIYPYVKPRLKLVMAGMLGLASVFLLLTLTLTAIGGVAIAVVIITALEHRKGLALGLVVGGMIGLIAIPGIAARVAGFSSADTSSATASATTQNSLTWRLKYWTEVLPLANNNPVTGIGLNSTQYETDAAKQPHNDFLRAYVETGLLGFGAYLCMLIALIGNARRAVQRAARGTLERAVGAGALGCGVCFIIGSVAANIMSMVVALFSLMAFSACASYVSRVSDPALASDPAVAGATRSQA